MSFPSRIGIATRGYRTGQSNPGRICIATYGYRCPEGEPPDVVDPFGGGKGHGAVILEPTERRPENLENEQLALLAVLAIDEWYG